MYHPKEPELTQSTSSVNDHMDKLTERDEAAERKLQIVRSKFRISPSVSIEMVKGENIDVFDFLHKVHIPATRDFSMFLFLKKP